MRYPSQQNHAQLTPVSGGYAFVSSFDRNLVDAFKLAIPPTDRRWDAAHKYWIVSAQYADACVRLAEIYLDVKISIPTQTRLNMAPIVETRIVKVDYLGRCKDRGNGELSATASVNGDWSVIFPEDVLREWFEAIPLRPEEKQTYYAVLCVKQSASSEELKSSWRRLARMWHPDVCKEENADRQFILIQHAYEILSNPLTRKKYDAGLAMQSSMSKQSITRQNAVDYIYSQDGVLQGYIPPLRCGYVMVEGVSVLGRLMVSKVLQWEDIINDKGQYMISSWPVGAATFEVNWMVVVNG